MRVLLSRKKQKFITVDASRALSDVEKIFSSGKGGFDNSLESRNFHLFLFGREMALITEHKLLGDIYGQHTA